MLVAMKDRLKKAMFEKNEIEKNILRVVISEVELQTGRQGGRPLPNEQIAKIIRKLVQSNIETFNAWEAREKANPNLETFDGGNHYRVFKLENDLLESFLPKMLNESEITSKLEIIKQDLLAAPNDGKAVGVAMSLFKQAGDAVDGSLVKNIVTGMRK